MTLNKAETADLFSEKIEQLSPQDLNRALQKFHKKITPELSAYLNSCVHCGLCADSCHYYLTKKESQSIPAYKLYLVNAIFKKYFTWKGKYTPTWVHAQEFNSEMIKEWIDCLYGRCTLCGRCAINCTIGINITALIRTGRGILAELDLVPPGLQSTVTTAIRTGNNMGIPEKDWIDTVKWLSDELKDEVGDPAATLPLNQKQARLLYTINPREPKFFPLSMVALGKIFYAAGESWTFSSEHYDVTNYGLYSGDDHVSGMISERLIRSMNKLKTEILVLGECGHGFNSNRWEAPEWLSRKYPFEVRSIIQILVEYIKTGRIRLDPAKIQKPVTLHDPCNLVRLGGIIEEPRYILKKAVSNFIEMHPNRENNYCCGGGGGQLSMTQFATRRIEAGKLKAQQIQKTGAKIVVAPCHNCIDQLTELNKAYKLGVEINTICEIVADALVIS